MQDNLAQPVKAQFELQTKLFKNAIEGITDADANTIYNAELNPVKWVAGHLLNTRLMVIGAITKQEPDRSMEQFFKKGTSKMLPPSCPTLEKIVEKWDETAPLLLASLSEATVERLCSAPPFQTSIPDTTLLGFVAYMSFHEAMHIGQLSILRKLIQKETMSVKAE